VKRLVCVVAIAAASVAMCPAAWREKPVKPDGAQRVFVYHRNGVEDLVLQSSYSGNAADFGMILPLPSVPESRMVKTDFFEELFRLSGGLEKEMRPAAGRNEDAAKPQGGGVVVVRRDVAGIFEVVTLKAESAKAFTDWLDKHGYRYDDMEAAAKVFQHYVDRKWYFAAIKVLLDKAPKAFQGRLQPMGLRFATAELCVPVKMASINAEGMDFTIYTLTAGAVTLPDFPAAFRKYAAPLSYEAVRPFKVLADSLDEDVLLDVAPEARKRILERAARDARGYEPAVERRYRGLTLCKFEGFYPKATMARGDLVTTAAVKKADAEKLAAKLEKKEQWEASKKSLMEAGPEAVESVAALLSSKDAILREAAAEVLGAIGSIAAADALVTSLEAEQEQGPRVAIGAALRDLSGEEFKSYEVEKWKTWAKGRRGSK
jgi:hypothetical protein